MSVPADRDHQSPLEAALVDVHTTLAALLEAADEQFVAVVEQDRQRLEGVTRQQERLAARLERAERRRRDALGDRLLDVALAEESAGVANLAGTIGVAVRQLQAKHSQTASLIEKSVELNGETIKFLQRLVGVGIQPAYGARGGATMARQSVLVDSRA
jgi:flagellar biosynthesis/type III secretory pathway chaperone